MIAAPSPAIADSLHDELVEEAPQPRRKSSCMAKLDRLAWVGTDWFAIDGFRFGVRTTSNVFAEWVRHALASYRAAGPEHEDDDAYWSVVIEDGSRGPERVGKRFHIVYRGTWDVVRTLDLHTAARAFLLELETIRFPARDDAIYLQAGLVRSKDASILVPYMLVPALARASRRVQRANLMAPGTMAIAIDPGSGRLTPTRSGLDLPADLEERLTSASLANGGDPRAFVETEAPADAVVLRGGPPEPGTWPLPRAGVLYQLASSVRNLDLMGGKAIEGLGRMLASSSCFTANWTRTEHMLTALATVGDSANGSGAAE